MNKKFIIIFYLLLNSILWARLDSLQVDAINFRGMSLFTESQLRDLMSVKEYSWISTSYFDENTLYEDLQVIKSFYLQEGFLHVKISEYELTYDADSSRVSVTIHIEAGTPAKVRAIRFKGNRYYSNQQIIEKLGLSPDGRFQQYKIKRAKYKIRKMYRTRGFLNSKVTLDVNWVQKDTLCELVYSIQENQRFLINDIRIEGLGISRASLVRRELEFARDQHVDLEGLSKSQQNLYQTGLFSSISLKPVDPPDSLTANTEKDILIKVKEAEPGQFDLALGFGTIEKVRASTELAYKNILGRAYRASLAARISSIEKKIETTLTDPWIFNIPWGMSMVGSLGMKEEPSYAYSYLSGKLILYKNFLDRSVFAMTGNYGAGTYDELRIGIFDAEYLGTLTPEEKETVRRIISDMDVIIHRASLKLVLLYDLRNNLFDTSDGIFIKLSSEFIYGIGDVDYLGSRLLRSINRILRSELAVRFYFPIDKATSLASAFELGIINNFSKEAVGFLLDDLFYAGGPNSIRGFDYKRVGPLASNGNPLGGELKLVCNLFEIRHRLFWIFSAVAFFDLGNVWAAPDNFKLSDIRFSPGIGLRIDTPVGLARIDYGFNPWPKSGESRGQYWIGIGQAF